MRSTIRCCQDCTKRYVGCHSDCQEYKGEKEKYIEEKSEVMKKYGIEAGIAKAAIDGKRRMMTRRKSHN